MLLVRKMIIFQGWSLFSVSASKIASKATENALKFSNIASKKMTEIGATVGDKVTHYFWYLI